jgi:hypothetical protein
MVEDIPGHDKRTILESRPHQEIHILVSCTRQNKYLLYKILAGTVAKVS